MTNIKTDISFKKELEVVFRSMLILDLLNNTLHIIAFSISMENILFDGTMYICVEVHLCKTTGLLKRDWIESFATTAYLYIIPTISRSVNENHQCTCSGLEYHHQKKNDI